MNLQKELLAGSNNSTQRSTKIAHKTCIILHKTHVHIISFYVTQNRYYETKDYFLVKPLNKSFETPHLPFLP